MAKSTSNETKSDRLALRADPKMRYGLELLARIQRRSLSSVIEWAILKAFSDPSDGLEMEESGHNRLTGKHSSNRLELLWDTDEIVRFLNLCFFENSLLSFDEEIVWDLIKNNGYYWLHDSGYNSFCWDVRDSANLNIEKVRTDWKALWEIAKGKKDKSSLLFAFWAEHKNERRYQNYSKYEIQKSMGSISSEVPF